MTQTTGFSTLQGPVFRGDTTIESRIFYLTVALKMLELRWTQHYSGKLQESRLLLKRLVDEKLKATRGTAKGILLELWTNLRFPGQVWRIAAIGVLSAS